MSLFEVSGQKIVYFGQTTLFVSFQLKAQKVRHLNRVHTEFFSVKMVAFLPFGQVLFLKDFF